jgi:hypothetical protein
MERRIVFMNQLCTTKYKMEQPIIKAGIAFQRRFSRAVKPFRSAEGGREGAAGTTELPSSPPPQPPNPQAQFSPWASTP